MVDINIVKVPGTKMLAKCVASSIGRVFIPPLDMYKAWWDAKTKKIQAKSDADILQLNAGAQAEAFNSLMLQNEEGKRLVNMSQDTITQQFESQWEKRKENSASVTQKAATLLENDEVPDHEPDHAWYARFFEYAQDVSDEDMRALWASILAGEVRVPGQTSPRTLDILRNMTQRDAQLFKNVCNFVIDDFVYFSTEYRTKHPVLSFRNVLNLQEIGLVYTDPLLSKNFENSSNEEHILSYQQENIILWIKKNADLDVIGIPAFLLTNSGRELYRIMESKFRIDYLQSLSSFLKGNDCELYYAHVIENHPDGSATATDFIPIKPKREDFSGGAS